VPGEAVTRNSVRTDLPADHPSVGTRRFDGRLVAWLRRPSWLGGTVLPARWERRHLVLVALVVLGLAHTLAVAPHYHFGSFDDDASYVEMAKALAAGAGLTSRLPQGLPLASTYPPGYSLLLTPLALVSGHAVWPYRLLSTVLFAVVMVLTWVYLGRRGVGERTRAVVLALLALNPVAATFATMVMAEMPFLVVLLALLLLVGRWERQNGVLTRTALAVCVCAAGLVWLKEAAIGLVLGLVLWLLVRRDGRRAAVTAGATAVLLVPVALVRLAGHTPLLGTRYSDELGGYYSGGLLHRVVNVFPHAAVLFVRAALPRSIVPTAWIPGRNHGVLHPMVEVLVVSAAPLVVLGFIRWALRHRDAAVLVVPVYVLESLAWPDVNERRVILVLPVILAWYALGAVWVLDILRAASRRLPSGPAALPAVVLPVAGALLVLVTLLVQFPRDYLYGLGGSTSRPVGSAYMDLLGRLGTPQQVVETDYLWTTSLLTGHRTRNTAFTEGCVSGPALESALRADNAAYLVSGTLNSGGLGNTCLLRLLYTDPHAVLLYAGRADDASVFELLGHGSPHAGLTDLLGSVPPVAGDGASLRTGTAAVQTPRQRPERDDVVSLPASGTATITWSWAAARTIGQLSTGILAPTAGGRLDRAVLQIRRRAGSWTTVAASRGPARFLLDSLPAAGVTAVRLVLRGRGTVTVQDVHALGRLAAPAP